MKVPPIKKDESLAMWRERLAREFNLSHQVKEILDAVSVESYIHGTNDIIDVLKKEGRL
jgi:hypothetical protein